MSATDCNHRKYVIITIMHLKKVMLPAYKVWGCIKESPFVPLVDAIVSGSNVSYGEKKEVLTSLKDCLWTVEVAWFRHKNEHLGKSKVNGRESAKFVSGLYRSFRETLDVHT